MNGLNTTPKDLNYPDSYTSINSYISYDLPLFTGFALYHQKGILKLQEKANEILYNLDKKNLEFEVLKAYNSAVLAKDFVKTMQKAKDTIGFIKNGAKEFHKNGLVTKIDVNEAELYFLNTNSNLIEAENNFKLSLAYLKFLTSNENISDVENLQNTYLEIKEFEDLYKIALKNRDEITLQNISIEANNKNIKANQGSYYPSVFTHLCGANCPASLGYPLCIRQFLRAVPVLLRGLPGAVPEDLGKIALGGIVQDAGNFRQRILSVPQKILCLLHPLCVEIVRDGVARFLPEALCHGLGAEPGQQGKVLLWIFSCRWREI